MSAFFWAVLTACLWGAVPVMEKMGLAKTQPFTALFYRSLGVVLGFLILGFFIVKPGEIRSVEPRSAALLILAGFVASFLAQIAFYHALRAGDVSRVVPVAGAYPLIAFILGVALLGENITLSKAAGMFFVICGAWLLK
ncbi:MAG: EamA family transporter [Candidatus Omnitrophota bacterium]